MNSKKKMSSYRAAKRQAARMAEKAARVTEELQSTRKQLSSVASDARRYRAEAQDMRRYGVPASVPEGLLQEVQSAMAREVGRRLAEQVIQQMGSEDDLNTFLVRTARSVAEYYAGSGNFSPLGDAPVIELAVKQAIEMDEIRATLILSGNYTHAIDGRQVRLYRG